MTVTRQIPGKINLFLDVLGKRPDGYHELRTIFLPVSNPIDEVTVGELDQPGLDVTCEHPAVPEGEANVCWQAAQEFAEATGVEPRWHISITKRIPVAAGMGGGSADAAATLLALNELCGNCLPTETLHGLAAGIGADVPFFLDPVPALGEGIGDRLRPVPLACNLSLVLVNPGFPVPVSWSYGNLDRVPRPPAPDSDALLAAMATGDFAGIASGVYNALEYAVRDKFPLVGMLREAMLAAGCATVAASGSGPTLFGLVEGDPEPMAATVRAEYGDDLWVQATQVRLA
ncbi:MAG: 4-(cytidine 5'-diphospho)-2-C-methyl-D-erythritol kinase, partial [Victivallales bacterium]|nr:4-(cytidine 5'-diphospho)-2-C-methyl-D-erythritol kinase [Victivallales bacterium]